MFAQNLVDESASHCQEKYGQERKDHWEGSLLEAHRLGLVWEDLIEEEDKEKELEHVYDVEEGNASLKVTVLPYFIALGKDFNLTF